MFVVLQTHKTFVSKVAEATVETAIFLHSRDLNLAGTAKCTQPQLNASLHHGILLPVNTNRDKQWQIRGDATKEDGTNRRAQKAAEAALQLREHSEAKQMQWEHGQAGHAELIEREHGRTGEGVLQGPDLTLPSASSDDESASR